jgi:CoA-transferase family III
VHSGPSKGGDLRAEPRQESSQFAEGLGQRWAESGGMWLTGSADGRALGCPTGVVEVLEFASRQLAENSRRFASEVTVDGLALLGERAALSSLSRQGSTSCGGATRLLQTANGYLALSLARPDDLTLLPALLGDDFSFESLGQADPLSDWVASCSASSEYPVGTVGSVGSSHAEGSPTQAAIAGESVWSQVEVIVKGLHAQALVDRGIELGLALATLATSSPPDFGDRLVGTNNCLSTTDQSLSDRLGQVVIASKCCEAGSSRHTTRPIRVVDLSSLWAGPLCGQLLGAAGCDVIKVESTARPDGARLGSPEFFDLLNGNKRSVSLDFANREDIRALIALLGTADVVIEASRPRALEQLEINRLALLGESGVSVWLQITGHGATGHDANRIGFGDDAAVAGGLVAWDDNQPVFCADAIADPATGLLAASAVLEALGAGGHWLLDASLRRTAESMSTGPTLEWHGEVAKPKVRAIPHRAPALGADTCSVISALSSNDTSSSTS